MVFYFIFRLISEESFEEDTSLSEGEKYMISSVLML